MKLLKYEDFILESRVEVKLPSILLRDFINKIEKIQSPISTEFKKITNRSSPLYRKEHKWTFIGVSDDDDKVIFYESYKVNNWIKDNYGEDANSKYMLMSINTPNLTSLSERFGTSKVEMKIGRFVKGYFGDTFSDSEIENFVNQWKSLVDDLKFEIWEGVDIINGYKSKNYHSNDYDNGINPLMNSCMNDEPSIKFYKYCPSVKLLVLLDGESAILGRALLWEDHKGEKFMDRVYFVYDKDYFKFLRWSKENGYWYKKNNTGQLNFIKDGKEVVIGTKVKILNAFNFPDEQYPYLDTFNYVQGEWAYNYEPNGNFWHFINTDGTYDVYDFEDTDFEEFKNNFNI